MLTGRGITLRRRVRFLPSLSFAFEDRERHVDARLDALVHGKVAFDRRHRTTELLDKLLQTPHTSLEEVDIASWNFALADRVEAHALCDASLDTRRAARELLITAVLAVTTAIAGADIAEIGRSAAGSWPVGVRRRTSVAAMVIVGMMGS